MIYLFKVLFYNIVLSYFEKPNFIVYDEWFDNDLIKKLNLNLKIKKQQIFQTYINLFMNNQIIKLVTLKITHK